MNLFISFITFSIMLSCSIVINKYLNLKSVTYPTKVITIHNRTNQNIFVLIAKSKNKIGIINNKDIDQLSEPLKAIAALYGAVGGSNCNNGECGLTSALKLGRQGSPAHKKILQKWFPIDPSVKQIVAQDCYQPSSGASISSDYAYLKLEKKRKVVLAYYHLIIWNKSKVKHVYAIDQYFIKDNYIQTFKGHILGGFNF